MNRLDIPLPQPVLLPATFPKVRKLCRYSRHKPRLAGAYGGIELKRFQILDQVCFFLIGQSQF